MVDANLLDYYVIMMNTLIKLGLVFIAIGIFTFLGLMFAILRVAVGGSGNPPLTGWFATLIGFILYIGFLFPIFLAIGAVLIIVELLKESKS